MRKDNVKKEMWFRGLFYLIGITILALGITLNIKAGLGVSPVSAVPYSISVILGMSFGNAVMIIYFLSIIIELILHTITKGKIKSSDGSAPVQKNLKVLLAMDLLQLPLSIVFTRFLDLFSMVVPDIQTIYADNFVIKGITLITAIVLTGIGAAMSLDMRLVTNASDGLVQVIADCIGKNLGFVKNCFDALNITITIFISLMFAGHLIGIGIGTVLAVFGTGRVIAVFNHLFAAKMTKMAGVKSGKF